MKKVLSNSFKVVALLAIFVLTMYAAGINYNFGLGAGNTIQKKTTTYANSQVDTLTFIRDAAVSGYALGVAYADSVNITTILLQRVVDGKLMALVAATDSLVGSAGFSLATATSTVGLSKAITLAPLADQYRIIITYAGSNNGVTAPNATYEIIKQYAK